MGMYFLVITFIMFIFPIGSIIAEIVLSPNSNIVFIIGKWFVFWVIGIRLFTAGIRQIIQPKFTAENILGLKEKESWVLVRELGFANAALGVLGILSLLFREWIMPCALSGGIFLGLAGINHIFIKNKNNHEKAAMISDILISILLITYFVLSLIKLRRPTPAPPGGAAPCPKGVNYAQSNSVKSASSSPPPCFSLRECFASERKSLVRLQMH